MTHWKIDNHQQMKMYRGLVGTCIVLLSGFEVYVWLSDTEFGNTQFVWLPLTFIIFMLLITKPKFIALVLEDDMLTITTSDIFQANTKKIKHIAMEDFKGSRLSKPNTLYLGKLIIEYKEDEETHETLLSLNNFKLDIREKLVKQLEALAPPTS